ncbi:ATP-binding protein [Nocardioides albus]|uniref:ATP-dependent DNA helicase RecG n=1 Tax=Nocardioides albus TaxID=1841 RepID=A0A7W5A2T3_9ACTN|nr:ATP-binding protein [Nocardioides albus]MBB3088244.1 ATP-dependent DNA helicase RecG [Nocardioides albus]
MRMETRALVEQMRRIDAEMSGVEVKAAVGGLPTTTVETISAFANLDGGTIILGLSEDDGFVPAAGFDATRIRDALANACANLVEPPCRAQVEIEEFENAAVVRLDVPELDPVEKPCYLKKPGAYGGSFIRGGDGDRLLTHYEVTQLLSNRTQPTHDQEVVERASATDLDTELVAAYLARVRRRSPRLRRDEDEQLLIKLGVLAPDAEGVVRPTLAGLLALGAYPQQFFPQLFVSFVALPGLKMGETDPDGRRFLDNASLTGPLPVIVADVIAMAIRNMRVGAIIAGLGRRDVYDYPIDVIREIVVNALMHRDYSPDARGSQVQIELYPDRLEVKSPGGLYGTITVADLAADDHHSTSRNQTLAAILADVEVEGQPGEALCENRGSGLHTVMTELRRAGMSPPAFVVRPGRVTVRVPQHALLGPETIEWISSLGQRGLTDAQHLALAMMRTTGRTTNAMLQAWGIDRIAAGQALKDLVDRGVAFSRGGRRYAAYHLIEEALPLEIVDAEPDDADVTTQGFAGVTADLDAVVQAIRAGHNSRKAIQDQLRMSQSTVSRRLKQLEDDGIIRRLHPGRSSRQRYRVVE